MKNPLIEASECSINTSPKRSRIPSLLKKKSPRRQCGEKCSCISFGVCESYKTRQSRWPSTEAGQWTESTETGSTESQAKQVGRNCHQLRTALQNQHFAKEHREARAGLGTNSFSLHSNGGKCPEVCMRLGNLINEIVVLFIHNTWGWEGAGMKAQNGSAGCSRTHR